MLSRQTTAGPQAGAAPATLRLYDDRVLWASEGFTGGRSVRPACALLVGARSKLRIELPSGHKLLSQAALISANVTRSVDARQAMFFSYSLDPAHRCAPAIRHLLPVERGVLDLGRRLSRTSCGMIEQLFDQRADCAAWRVLSDQVFAELLPELSDVAAIDARILATSQHLREHLPSRVGLEGLARHWGISRWRLAHLFSEELGVSASSYLRWAKLCRAAHLFSAQCSITEVAAAIGFADAPHLNRVFRSCFSVKPSMLADPRQVDVRSAYRNPPSLFQHRSN